MHFVTPYLHRSNPAERLNRSILERMKTECLYDGEFRKKSWLNVVSDCQSWLNNSVKQVEKVSAMEIHFHPSKISDKRSVVEEHHLKYLKETVGEKYEQYNNLRIVKFKNRIHTAAMWNGKMKENPEEEFTVGEMCLYFDGGRGGHKLSCPAEGPFLITEVCYPYVWLKGVQNPSSQFKTVEGMIKKIKNVEVEQLQEASEDEMDVDVIAPQPVAAKSLANTMSFKGNYKK